VTRQMALVVLAIGLCGPMLAGCDSAQGAVAGVLVGIGGPAPGGPYPYRGLITVAGSSGSYHASAGANGRFRIAVPPGTYHVTGASGHFEGPTGCDGGLVNVRAGQQTSVTVACEFP